MTFPTELTRRDFLKSSAAGGAALVIGFYLPWDVRAQEGPQPPKPVHPFNAWVRIDRDARVTLILAKSEMGQGVITSLPVILAEELDMDWKQVRIEQAATRPDIYPSLGTGGSSSVRESFLPLRQAGAAARQLLIAAAAQTWGVAAGDCYTRQGAVIHRPTGRRLGYGELVERAAALPLPDLATVPLKDPADFRLIGQSTPRVDIPAKVDGSAGFGLDVRLPGMLYAVVARCPTFGGKAARFDASRARGVPGVRHVVEIPAVGEGAHTAGGVAVVADSTWAAIKGRDALAVEWDRGPHASESSEWLQRQFEELAGKPANVVREEGDALAALERAGRKLEATYEVPFLAHATMEPMNCTADVRPDRAEMWAPTQAPQWALDALARVTGLPHEKCTVHTTLMGGGFGRRYMGDFPTEAAQISKAVGAPVQLLWTRDDDMQHDFYRPASYHRLRAGVDARGQLQAWFHRMVSVSISSFWAPPGQAKPEQSEISGAVDLPYAVLNFRMEYAPARCRVPVAWWRSVEHSNNAFVVESFFDEVAAAGRR